MRAKQSLSGFIREHLVLLEAQLFAGIRQEVIIEELEAKGFATSLACFRTLLYRARLDAAARSVVEPTPNEPRVPKSKRADTKPESKAKSESPLQKPAGFQYSGKIDPTDLV